MATVKDIQNQLEQVLASYKKAHSVKTSRVAIIALTALEQLGLKDSASKLDRLTLLVQNSRHCKEENKKELIEALDKELEIRAKQSYPKSTPEEAVKKFSDMISKSNSGSHPTYREILKILQDEKLSKYHRPEPEQEQKVSPRKSSWG